MKFAEILIKTTRRKKRVGRGGKRGTTSGRGTKGQKSRAGHRIRPALRDLIRKIPKKRGTKFSLPRTAKIVVDFRALEKHFSPGEKVTPRTLDQRGVINLPRHRNNVVVKILSRGEITKKLIFENVQVSKPAADKIFASGGEVRNIK